ncbi:stress-responsive protein Ycf46 [Candidatus Atelocyanobacterium thalassae]|uniref:Uncharacterized AAA domain-containing protein ycf46 n=1 Tax=cyanobacterium endosymbiont of Braarudosphaera bigelowii TaxID=1285375 RepID=A0ABM7UCM3_9CHRO|nr:AAA family ATPase [Candidatus Atelocyanobacterium thalassa]BDA39285.1 ATP-dependent zinc metalloprotease FtsH [cyanobacterium endosymbiont of Braarudosphaera bigelowii]
MKEELKLLIEAQYPLIYLVTSEEQRAEQTIDKIIKDLKEPRCIFSWTITNGMKEYNQPSNKAQHNTINAESAIDWVNRKNEPGIFIFKDLHPFISDASVVRSLRDAIISFKGCKKSIIIISPVQQIPIELEKDIVVLDFNFPNLKDLDQVLSKQLNQIRTSSEISTSSREKLLYAALGLTKDEAEKVYRKAYVQAGKLTEAEVDIILSEKKQQIRRNGILEYIEQDETIKAVGGLEELKKWLKQRSDAFTERAREYGLPQPKGMLILGVPGCGKSLIAKTTSRLWGLPLLRLDLGRIYDSAVGRSEANLRNALKTAESISPAILFIDELDKAFAGAGGSGESDGGTSSRIFGSFLTWMQEKTSPVFVMATANRVERLPGEFLRKGRFDELFFVDLPTFEEREAIFNIHLNKRRSNISHFDIKQLVTISDGFSGAEVEQAIIAAMYEAFAEGRDFSQLDIIAAIKSTLPLSRTMTEQVAALRDWARQRARPASTSIAEYQRLEF